MKSLLSYFLINCEISDYFASLIQGLDWLQLAILFLNFIILIGITRNSFYKKKKGKIFEILKNFLGILKYILKQIKKICYILFLLLIIGIIIASFYNKFIGFNFEDHYIFHVCRLLTIFFLMSIFSQYLFSYGLSKKIPKFINVLENITLGRFLFGMGIYTIFIYYGLAYHILVQLLPFLNDIFISFISSIGKFFISAQTSIKFNPLGIGLFKKILTSYPLTLTRKSRFIVPYSDDSVLAIKLNSIKLGTNYLDLIKQSNFIRNLLFSKPNFPIYLRKFNNLDLKYILNLIGEKKLYISNCIVLKSNHNFDVKVYLSLNKSEIYINIYLKNDICVFASNNKDFISSLNNSCRYQESFRLGTKNLTLFNKDYANQNLNFDYLNGSPYNYQEITVNMYHGDTPNDLQYNEELSNENVLELAQSPDYADYSEWLAMEYPDSMEDLQVMQAELSNLYPSVQGSYESVTNNLTLNTQNINTPSDLMGQIEQANLVSNVNINAVETSEDIVINDNHCDPTSNISILDWTVETEKALRLKEAKIIENALQFLDRLNNTSDSIHILDMFSGSIDVCYIRFLLMSNSRQFRTELHLNSNYTNLLNSDQLRTAWIGMINTKIKRYELIINMPLDYNLDNVEYKQKRWMEASILSLCRYPLMDRWRSYITNPVAENIIESKLESIRIYDLQNNMKVRLGINKIINRLQRQFFPDN